ncbi:hypothetical protein BCR33DRAFT_169961 [Rhizoclosmatium globosum]|uniref:Nitrogen regulatory protein areA GATA-like domain-containing protein n=1 Tax=Rhizoclosmatium globosum TaxID=329046 RepID=A0A1Y2CGV0_9FUNG|nr:hypothetical protein BCR33DRAFT_169961 [Rhizoclosmatium globosum]|eukprot:ORY45545.1 hypothetical protein BCR33DRAFT_169961 [Rhizoclosmatium globosum]
MSPLDTSDTPLDKQSVLKLLVEHPLPSKEKDECPTSTSTKQQPPSTTTTTTTTNHLQSKVNLRTPVDIDATESLTNLLGKLKGFAGTEDPSATESIWRLCTKAKAALPSGDRLENLSWRLLHMSLKKKKEKEDAAAAALSASLPADHQAKLEPASPSMSDFFDMNLTDDSQAFFSASAPAFNNNNNNQTGMQTGKLSSFHLVDSIQLHQPQRPQSFQNSQSLLPKSTRNRNFLSEVA